MKIKEQTKIEARSLRRQGHSLSEISESLQISKSTASLWVRDVLLNEDAIERIEQRSQLGREQAANTHRAATDRKINASRMEATSILAKASYNSDAERLICALLYWCEGAKIRSSKNTFAFTNSDPELVVLFLDLLRRNFPIDETKFRLQLHVHAYHEQEAQLQFWSKVTTIPLTQCNRPYQKQNTTKRVRDGYQGCVSIRYQDIDLARRLEAIAVVFLRKEGL